MDDADPAEAAIVAATSSQEPTVCNYDLWKTAEKEERSPCKGSEVMFDGDADETSYLDMDDGRQMQNSSSTGQPQPQETIDDEQGQYIPLVQLMQPIPSRSPPQSPPASPKSKNSSKGRKAKGCYHELAENLAVELASMNEKLHKKLRSSLDVLQTKEPGDVQGLGEVEEDSYVFVNQQGDY